MQTFVGAVNLHLNLFLFTFFSCIFTVYSLNMSSSILSALCRSVPTTFYRPSLTNQLFRRKFEVGCPHARSSCSRHFSKLGSSSSRLNAQRWSSTSCSASLPSFGVRRGAGHLVERNKQTHLTTICRPISVSAQLLAKKSELVTVHFINRDGEKITVKGKVGQNLLDTVLDNDLDIDGYGACEGTLSCSTCHLIFSDELFQKLPKPSDEELDMLDLAYGQTDMSRLGCQVILTKEMEGMTVVVPEGVADARDP